MIHSSQPGYAKYLELRQRALHFSRPGESPEALTAVLMDWAVDADTATVFAASDGTASVYLSDGSTFTGGSQTTPAVRKAALRALQLGQLIFASTIATQGTPLPQSGEVFFYFLQGGRLSFVKATEGTVHQATSSLATLAAAMHEIAAHYRTAEQARNRHDEARPASTAPIAAPRLPPAPRWAVTPTKIWGKEDHFGRGVQAACGVTLLLAAAGLFYFAASQNAYNSYRGGSDLSAITCLILGVRCLWYAVTGRDNVNRDDF